VITTYCQRGEHVERELTPEALGQALAQGDALVWVDIAGGERAEGEPLLDTVFGFHHLTIDDCYNTLIDPPKVDDYGRYLFVITHDVQYDPATHEMSVAELDMYIGPNYVASLHRQPLASVEAVRHRADNRSLVLDRGADFLAHALFDVVVDGFHPVVEALDDEIADVQERVLAVPSSNVLTELLTLKRNAQRLKRSILPQRDVVTRFSRGEYPKLIRPESLMYFRDVYDHTVRVEEMIDSVRDLADSALNTYLSSVNNRLNEVMKALAIVAVVFLPLTLITGIYGTNFHDTFPQYSWTPGFLTMIASMGAIVVALFIWFRWRRWV
jgi:magnesium transporter